MWYRYLDDFPCSILVSAIYCYGIAVLGIPQCPPLNYYTALPDWIIKVTKVGGIQNP